MSKSEFFYFNSGCGFKINLLVNNIRKCKYKYPKFKVYNRTTFKEIIYYSFYIK